MSLGDAVPFRLNARVCDVCFERQTEMSREFWNRPSSRLHYRPDHYSPALPFSSEYKSPKKNSKVCVSRSRAYQIGNSQVRVCSTANSVHTTRRSLSRCNLESIEFCNRVSAGYSNRRSDFCRAVSEFCPDRCYCPRLSHKTSLKVMIELQIDNLPVLTLHKQPLICLIVKYIDTYAENDSDDGITSLTFYEIDTADIRPLSQLIRRLPYGEIRAAV